MRLYGQAIPLDDGGYVVTVVCPNRGSFERLMLEVSRIEADAFAPHAPTLTPEQEAYIAASEAKDADQPEDMGLNVGIHMAPATDTGD